MGRILVAVDFSGCSRSAFQTAVSVARVFDADLHVVHVLSEIYGHLRTSNSVLPIAPDATGRERGLSELILEEFKGSADEFARIDKRILEGIDYLEILKEAERTEASMIVAGTHGRSALERAFLGSVSDRLLRKAKVPVLLVPEGANPQPEKLLVALGHDGAAETEHLLRTAATWKTALDGTLTALHVIEYPPDFDVLPLSDDMKSDLNLAAWEEQLRQSLEWTMKKVLAPGDPSTLEIRHGRPHREICRSVKEDGFELVLLGSQGATRQGPGMTALRVAHRAPCSVLVAR